MKIMKLFAKLLFIEVNGRADFRRKEKEKKNKQKIERIIMKTYHVRVVR